MLCYPCYVLVSLCFPFIFLFPDFYNCFLSYFLHVWPILLLWYKHLIYMKATINHIIGMKNSLKHSFIHIPSSCLEDNFFGEINYSIRKKKSWLVASPLNVLHQHLTNVWLLCHVMLSGGVWKLGYSSVYHNHRVRDIIKCLQENNSQRGLPSGSYSPRAIPS